MAGYSAALPLIEDSNDGFRLLQTLQQVALQNVKMILFTEPGERIWDLNFGVGIKRYLFEQNTPSRRNELKLRISNQISTYLPYINIIKLDINAISENDEIIETSNFLKVTMLFSISGLGNVVFNETFSL
jgi:phage baseplate assembly protein W